MTTAVKTSNPTLKVIVHLFMMLQNLHLQTKRSIPEDRNKLRRSSHIIRNAADRLSMRLYCLYTRVN
jgi:hypothetical protein